MRESKSGACFAAYVPTLPRFAGTLFIGFLCSKDYLHSINIGFPRGNPYRNIGVNFDTGRQEGSAYQSVSANAAYLIGRRLQLTLRHQTVSHKGIQQQDIGSLSYDLGNDMSISGRAVRRGNNMNAYLAFRRSGNEGIEYFLILGDPNALKYRNSLVLKVTIPLELGSHGLRAPFLERHSVSVK